MFRQTRHNGTGSHHPSRRRRRAARASGHPLPRRLRIEPLEDRRMLSTITVNTTVDELDGSLVDGDISLRDAIVQAMPGDTINFSVAGTITLTRGILVIGKDLEIAGPGASALRITHVGQIIAVDNGSTSLVNVELSGVTLTGGADAIVNRENLTVSNCTISGNFGRGITSRDGALIITGSTVSENSGGGVYCRNGSVAARPKLL
jgi:hypothetical protein